MKPACRSLTVPRRAARAASQRGATLVVVLVLLLVMLLGGLAMARVGEVGTLVAGNIGFKERALQAAEVGINTAMADVVAMVDDNTDTGWYAAQRRATDGDGLPTGVSWDSMPERQVGSGNQFSVRWFVDRQCMQAAVTDPARQCLLRQTNAPSSGTVGKCDDDCDIDPPSGKQFRITVRVTAIGRDGRGDMTTFVQSLVTKP